MYTLHFEVTDCRTDEDGTVKLAGGCDEDHEDDVAFPFEPDVYTEFFVVLSDDADDDLGWASERLPWDGEHDITGAYEGTEIWDRLAERVVGQVVPGFTGRIPSTCNIGDNLDFFFEDGKAKCETEIWDTLIRCKQWPVIGEEPSPVTRDGVPWWRASEATGKEG